MCPGYFSRTCDGLAPSGSRRNPLGAVLNDGLTCRAAPRDSDGRACLSLHSGVGRRSGDVHPQSVSHITMSVHAALSYKVATRFSDAGLAAREPQRDLALC
jgi:hypothetical protein